MNSCVFDIETTNLGAIGAGIILCVCIRPMDAKQRTRTFRVDREKFEHSSEHGFLQREETALLKAVFEELGKYDVLIGHNVIKFDWPYLKSRAFQHGVDSHFAVLYDTMHAFRRTGYLTNLNSVGKPMAGLAMVGDFFNVKQEKTSIFPNEWWLTVWGNEIQRLDTLKTIADHCERDVRMNAAIFPYLWKADPRPTLRRVL